MLTDLRSLRGEEYVTQPCLWIFRDDQAGHSSPVSGARGRRVRDEWTCGNQ